MHEHHHEIAALRRQMRDVLIHSYREDVLFSTSWWVLLLIVVASFAVWWFAVDRSRLREMVTFAMFVALTTTLLDEIGLAHVLWVYDHRLFPVIPPIVSLNWGVMPIAYMLVH